MSPKNKTNFSPRLDSRLIAYTALAGAALAAPALPSAEATIITNNINLAIPADADGIYLNFLTGATATAAFSGWDINPYLSNAVFTLFWPNSATTAGGVDTASGANIYAALTPGSVVSAASPYTRAAGAGGAGSTINYQTTGQHILGFRFLNEGTGVVNYGYATFNNNAPNGFPATLVSYSYENNGGAITVVPEPTTFALLGVMAAGAVGVRVWRRRNAA
jgi:hypothetical protein